LVFENLQGARLGLLDLERFKRYLRYCEVPNGTFADMALQVHSRWQDTSDFDSNSQYGIWFENFALPVVINECLLQSYNGTLRFFPNWPLEISAEFQTLRAVGGFLVSARCMNGKVEWIEVISEVGSPLRATLPWPAKVTTSHGSAMVSLPELRVDTRAGETVRIEPACNTP
jgi:alpha-L-fucosidase 2